MNQSSSTELIINNKCTDRYVPGTLVSTRACTGLYRYPVPPGTGGVVSKTRMYLLVGMHT